MVIKTDLHLYHRMMEDERGQNVGSGNQNTGKQWNKNQYLAEAKGQRPKLRLTPAEYEEKKRK